MDFKLAGFAASSLVFATASMLGFRHGGATLRHDDVTPTKVFQDHCTSCHGASNPAAGLDLTVKLSDLAAKPSLIKPGDPEHSHLFRMVKYADPDLMPKGGPKLSDDEIAVLAKWITGLKPDPAKVLHVRCATCHGGDHPAAGIDLSVKLEALANNADMIKKGDPEHSVLYRTIKYADPELMPKNGPKLPDAEIAAVGDWIKKLTP